MENHDSRIHVIDITVGDAFRSDSPHDDNLPQAQSHTELDRPSTVEIPSSASRGRFGNPTFTGHVDGYGSRSPLNSGLWISVELIVTLGQIIASIVILSLSRHENPEAPLFAWVVGYACGCMATVPVLYWRFCNQNMGQWRETAQLPEGPSQSFPSPEASYVSNTVALASHNNSPQLTQRITRNNPVRQRMSLRFNGIVDHLKMVLDCFFAVWFIVGNVWIFGGHASPSDAPNLYRLCIVFLIVSCIGYAMPFILCATVCFCLPCLVRALGFREDFSQTRGVTQESINALPIYQFNLYKDKHDDNQDIKSIGVLSAGTQKQRSICGEDAVCCICLAAYSDNDELRELPCSHLFHTECVDKWLKISASCPLCKLEVGEKFSTSTSNANRQLSNDTIAYQSATGTSNRN